MSEPTAVTSVCADQRQRWQQGERVLVEAYLETQPALREDPEGVLDLIYNEINLRQKKGDVPRLDEYVRRFPRFQSEIQMLFEVHQAVEAECLAVSSSQPASPMGNGASGQIPSQGITPGYQLLKELGRGAFGIVYEARQIGLDRRVALKMVLAGAFAGPEELARFRREALAAARLHHPEIVQIYEVSAPGARPFFSMELVDGGTLARRLAGTPQPARQAAQLAATLARTIHYAHAQGVVHRDLKPSNILLTLAGTPKISDFGLAKRLDAKEDQTHSGAIVGTPGYMAPEQANGLTQQIGPPADIHALGAILYELLTGRPPFQGTTVLETLEHVRSREAVPPTRLQPKVPRDLETICLKCLRKEAAQRYRSALELADDLQRFLVGEPIRARPISACQRLVKWARRQPAAATLVILGILTVLTVIVGAWWAGLSERNRVASLRDRSQRELSAGRSAFVGRQWTNAKPHLVKVLTLSDAEPALVDLALQATELLAETDRQLANHAARAKADTRYRQFNEWYGIVLFHGMNSFSDGGLFTGMDGSVHAQATADAAQRALAAVEIAIDPRSSVALDPWLDDSQCAEVRSGCYTLLLFVAEAVAQHSQPKRSRQHSYQEALRILERARDFGPPTRAYHLRRAWYLEQLGDHDGCRGQRELALALQPVNALDFFLLGDALAKRGELQQAIREFDNALGIQPSHFWSQCYLAVCCLRQQRWSEAKASLSACLSQQPRFVWASLLRGLAHCELGAFAAAEADFAQAQRSLTREPNLDAQYSLHLNCGLLRFRQERFEEARADFQQASHLKPNHFAAYVNLARVYRKQENDEAARQQLDEALRHEPPPLVLADFHLERGRELARAKRYQEAVTACQTALAYRADHAIAYRVLGEAQLQLRRYPEAVRAFDQFLKTGGAAGTDVYRARGQARMHCGDYPGAVEDYTRALDFQADFEAYQHRGWAYFFADAWKPALRDFEQAIRMRPENADAYVGRGLARVLLGQFRAAVADADEALRRKPATPEMMHNLACIFAQAVAKVEADAREPQRQALATRYRERAVQAIGQTLTMLHPEQRAAFWREKIVPDTALDPIRHSAPFMQLMAQVAEAAK